MGRIVFITGGVRSGKSSLAVKTAGGGRSVLFLATALASDEEMRRRIENHRLERPADWRTVEVTEGRLEESLEGEEEILLVDCLTLYVARRISEGITVDEITEEIAQVLDKMRDRFELSIIVSNEVGSGVVPDNELARHFSEVLGQVNRLVAGGADEVLLLVSGIPVKVK